MTVRYNYEHRREPPAALSNGVAAWLLCPAVLVYVLWWRIDFSDLTYLMTALAAVICAVATVAGFGLASVTGDEFRAAASGFAAGALLVMLVDSMVPEAQSKAKESTGLATVLGFALAAGLALAS